MCYVRIYVDIILNHMAGLGREGQGSAGTYFKSDDRHFPGVPYDGSHFNARDKCPSGSGNIENYQDPNQVPLSLYIRLSLHRYICITNPTNTRRRLIIGIQPAV